MNWQAFWRGFRDGFVLIPRWLLAWGLFILGDVVSRIEDGLPDNRFLPSVYPVYNWLMVKSGEMQPSDYFGPWRPTKARRDDDAVRD